MRTRLSIEKIITSLQKDFLELQQDLENFILMSQQPDVLNLITTGVFEQKLDHLEAKYLNYKHCLTEFIENTKLNTEHQITMKALNETLKTLSSYDERINQAIKSNPCVQKLLTPKESEITSSNCFSFFSVTPYWTPEFDFEQTTLESFADRYIEHDTINAFFNS